MPRKHVFLYLWCAGTDITKKQAKTRKNGHESMKGSKADAGKHFSRPDNYLSSMCHINSQLSSNAISSPWINFAKNGRIALGVWKCSLLVLEDILNTSSGPWFIEAQTPNNQSPSL